jgi:hypothetical protein
MTRAAASRDGRGLLKRGAVAQGFRVGTRCNRVVSIRLSAAPSPTERPRQLLALLVLGELRRRLASRSCGGERRPGGARSSGRRHGDAHSC